MHRCVEFVQSSFFLKVVINPRCQLSACDRSSSVVSNLLSSLSGLSTVGRDVALHLEKCGKTILFSRHSKEASLFDQKKKVDTAICSTVPPTYGCYKSDSLPYPHPTLKFLIKMSRSKS